MKLRFASAFVALSLMAGAFSGCSADKESATPTPVAFKSCLISTSAGFNDGGINQAAYFGLQQAVVQMGTSVSVLEAKTDSAGSVTAAGKKLVSRGCNLVMAVGQYSYDGLLPLANGNPDVKFVALDFRAGGQMLQAADNLTIEAIDTRLAYLQAGYLAAASSKQGIIGVIGASTPGAIDEIWYLRQGVFQYLAKHGKTTQILGADRAEPETWSLLDPATSPSKISSRAVRLISSGADVLVSVGVNGLPAAQAALAGKAVIIGDDTDWSLQSRYATVKAAILASVLKPIADAVTSSVSNAMGLSVDPGAVADGAAWIATLTPEADVKWPQGISGELQQLASDYAAGKLSVIDEPARY
jgi:basic membrane protein A